MLPNCLSYNLYSVLTVELCEDWPLLQLHGAQSTCIAHKLAVQWTKSIGIRPWLSPSSASAILRRGWLYHRSRNLTVNPRYSGSPASGPVVVWAMPLCRQGDTCLPQSLWGHIPPAILLLGQPLPPAYERLRCSGNTDLHSYPPMASRPKMSV